MLDAGCGTGGFLRWLLDRGSFAAAAGVDIGSAAIELARRRVPEADCRSERCGSCRSRTMSSSSW